jgi:hypothetical protein
LDKTIAAYPKTDVKDTKYEDVVKDYQNNVLSNLAKYPYKAFFAATPSDPDPKQPLQYIDDLRKLVDNTKSSKSCQGAQDKIVIGSLAGCPP